MRLRALAVAAIAGLVLLGTAAPAAAHDQLLGSSPQNGAVLEVAPSEVSLSFNEAVLDLGNAIIVNDNNGDNWINSEVTAAGDGVSASLKPGMPDGVYTMEWRVVSADGHPVSGTIIFGVGTSQAIADEVTIALAAIGAPVDDDGAPTSGAGSTEAASGNIWQIVGIGALGAVVALALFAGAVTIIRRNQRPADPTESSDNDS